jgi:hypothetical protein
VEKVGKADKAGEARVAAKVAKVKEGARDAARREGKA